MFAKNFNLWGTRVANCRQCRAQLPTFSVGELRDLCPACQPLAQPARSKKPHPLGELPQLYPAASKWWTATNLLLAINCGVFLLMCITGASPVIPNSQDLLRWGADYGPYTLSGQYWRLVTSSFVHIGILHLAVNMYCLWRFGAALEKLFRPLIIVAAYLLTGAGASLLSLSWNPMRVSAGASGALFGIIGILISLLSFAKFHLEEASRRRMLGYVAKLALVNLFYGLIGNVDNMAHLGGLVTGLMMGMFLARAVVKDTDESRGRETNVLIATLIALSLVTIPVIKAKAYASELGKGIRAAGQADCRLQIVHLQKYLALRPVSAKVASADAYAHQQLAYCLHLAQRYDEAEREYEAILVADPNDRWAQLNLAAIEVGRNDLRAIYLFEQARQSSELGPEDYKNYGQALQNVHRLQDSEDALRKSIALDGNDPEAQRILADVILAQRRPQPVKGRKSQ